MIGYQVFKKDIKCRDREIIIAYYLGWWCSKTHTHTVFKKFITFEVYCVSEKLI